MSNAQSTAIFSLTLLFAPNAFGQQASISRAEVDDMLRERDAIIIALQHTVNSLRERLDAIEGPSNTDQSVARSDQARTTAPLPSTESDFATLGGPDPMRLVVDEAAAERALERTLVQRGALLLPRGRIELSPALAYSHRESEIPGLVELEAGLAVAQSLT